MSEDVPVIAVRRAPAESAKTTLLTLVEHAMAAHLAAVNPAR